MERGKADRGKAARDKGQSGKGVFKKGGAAAGHDAAGELFKLPLDQFTAARNAAAARLKKGGHREAADAIRALNKPPLSAWAVNQLYWRHPRQLEALLEAGERFRRAQAEQLAGNKADLRGTLDRRRQALAELTRTAADILRESRHTPGPDIERRVTTTLEALAAYGHEPGAPKAGYLTEDIDPPGFEALAALIPRSGASGERAHEPRLLKFHAAKPAAARKKKLSPEEATRQQREERRARMAAAKAAVQQAEQALRAARTTGERAEAALKKAAAAAKQTEKDRAEMESRLERATAAANTARLDARRIAAEAEDAAQAVTDAERALAKARSAAAELE